MIGLAVTKLAESTFDSTANTEVGNLPPIKKKASTKKILLTLITIAVIATIVATLMIPKGAATLPLEVNYTVGEKMVYDTTMNASFQYNNSSLPIENSILPNASNIEMTQTIEVTGFDGEYYTLNHTLSMNSATTPISVSLIEKMNKTGYSTYLFDLGTTQQEIPTSNSITSNSYLTQLLSKPEVKVGDTVKVPFPTIGNSTIDVTGDVTMTFKGVQDLTVPAGTYKVFRIDLSCNNLQMTYRPQIGGISNLTPIDITMNSDLNYQIYIEYGTMRQIKSSMQETITVSSAAITGYSMTENTDMTLIEHSMPS